MFESIIVAIIGSIGIIMASLFQAMRKENKNDHDIVADSLNRIEVKIDGHITDHAKGDL